MEETKGVQKRSLSSNTRGRQVQSALGNRRSEKDLHFNKEMTRERVQKSRDLTTSILEQNQI